MNPLTVNECGTNITIKGIWRIETLVSYSKRDSLVNNFSQIYKILRGKIPGGETNEIEETKDIFKKMVERTKKKYYKRKKCKENNNRNILFCL